MNNKLKLFVGLASVALLAACGNNNAAKEATSEKADVTKNPFPQSLKNDGTAVKDGVLRYGLVSASPIAGIMSHLYYTNDSDSEVYDFLDEGIFGQDADYRATENLAKLDIDKDKKTLTVTFKKDVKWSDGQPLTIDDYIYTFEVIGHKDYTGSRYNDDFANIVGMEEYHAGTASTISGITRNDDYSATFQLKEVSPAQAQIGGFWAYATPKHVFKDIPLADQAASDAVRKNPVGLGPFRVTKVVAGESVTYEANPYYHKGQPKLKGVIVEVLNPTNAADEFKAGKYDIMNVPTDTATVDAFKKLDNADLLGSWTTTYNYLGFKLGKYDKTAGKNETDANSKLADKRVRQALGYALNIDEITTEFYGSLRSRANTLLAPTFEKLHDKSLTGFNHDPEKAKKLLDEAGFKDVDGDKIREDANGNKFTLKLAFMAGGETAEPLSKAFLQYWKEVGLDVQLTDGRLLEFNSFYERVEADDPEIDLYIAGWQTTGNPNPISLWGDTSTNYTRFVSEKQNDMFKEMGSSAAFDADKQLKMFKDWQAYQLDEAYAVPLFYRTSVTAFNKRIKEYVSSRDSSKSTGSNLQLLELIADEPVKAK